jgi:hypothetical protein
LRFSAQNVEIRPPVSSLELYGAQRGIEVRRGRHDDVDDPGGHEQSDEGMAFVVTTGQGSPVATTGGQSQPPPPVAEAVLNAVAATLRRRGFLTSEWWTSIVALALTATIALAGTRNQLTVQIVAIAAPVVVAASYAYARSAHKSKLAQLVLNALFGDQK